MQELNQNNVDVKENLIIEKNPELLEVLLKDYSTKRNIIWATDDYSELGAGYGTSDEITVEAITGTNGNIIMPRSVKSKETQGNRTRNMAEVFTPTWICNKMNNLVDSAWFRRENIFNVEEKTVWNTCIEKIVFPNKNKTGAGSWMDYIAAKRLEITCGEAPYLVSRYDTVTGDTIPLENRIGILDRKLRVINEKVRNFKDVDRAKKRWLQLAKLAVQNTYGFEWQGDNVLLARENLLYTVIDYFKAKFSDEMPTEWLLELAKIIAWNIWQMDGIKCVVPNSCHDYKKQRKPVEPSLFDVRAFGATTLKRSVSICDVNEDELQKCQGCLKDNVDLHNGIYCKIKNWSNGKVYKFKDLLNKQESEVDMSKDFKFDVVIGNPPYQIEDDGNGRSAKPVYNLFVVEGAKVCSNYMSLILPARWYAGGKGLDDFRNFMLNNRHIKILHDYVQTNECFPGVNIRGGVCYFLWQSTFDNNLEKTLVVTHNNETTQHKRNLKYKDVDLFIRYNEAISILEKVTGYNDFRSVASIISSRKPFGIEGAIVNTEHFLGKNDNRYNTVLCYGRGQKLGRVDRSFVLTHSDWIDCWKVYMPYANNIGTELNDDNQNSFVGEPDTVATETFLVVGADLNLDEGSARNLSLYLKTKFARFLLSLVKISQHGTAQTYRFVPIQDFSKQWTDKELYQKYNFTDAEIAFIEKMIKPME